MRMRSPLRHAGSSTAPVKWGPALIEAITYRHGALARRLGKNAAESELQSWLARDPIPGDCSGERRGRDLSDISPMRGRWSTRPSAVRIGVLPASDTLLRDVGGWSSAWRNWRIARRWSRRSLRNGRDGASSCSANVAVNGGVFKLTDGPLSQFGPRRVRARRSASRRRRRGNGRGDDRLQPVSNHVLIFHDLLGSGREPDTNAPHDHGSITLPWCAHHERRRPPFGAQHS